MSGKIMGQVWDLDLPTNEQLVLLAMADHADHIGENIYPSVGLIAWKTGYSERTIQRLIKSLLKKEILKVQKRRPGKTTIYCTAFENAPLRQPYKSEQTPDIDVTPDTKDVTPTPDTQMSPEPSLEPSTKIKDSIASPDGNAAGDDEKAIAYGMHVVEQGDVSFKTEELVFELTPPDPPDDDIIIGSDVYPNQVIQPPAPKKERQPNPWYDAVKDTMGVEGFKNGNIVNTLRCQGKKDYAKYDLETPLTEPEQIHIFWAWYQSICAGCSLSSPATVQDYVMRWQREGMPDVRIKIKREWGGLEPVRPIVNG